MKDDGLKGGKKRLCERNGVAKQRCTTAEARWATLGFTAASGDPVLCVVIIKAKELSPLDILGVDIFQSYDKSTSMEENTGPGMFSLVV